MWKNLILACTSLFVWNTSSGQSITVQADKESITQRLDALKLINDGTARIQFYSGKKENVIQQVYVEISPLVKSVNLNKLVGKKSDETGANSTVVLDQNYTIDQEGGINFSANTDVEYKITSRSAGYEETINFISGKELLFNDNIAFDMKSVKCKNLTGLLAIKNIVYGPSNILIRILNQQSGVAMRIPVDPNGYFPVCLEFGKSYMVEAELPNGSKYSIKLPIVGDEKQSVNQTFYEKDFDIFIREQGKDVLTHSTINGILTGSHSNTEMKKYFLGSSQLSFKEGQVIQLGKYAYDYNTYILSDNCKRELELLDQLLKLNPDLKLALRVHTDCNGSKEFNQRFTLDIADKLVKFLTNRGIDPKRLKARGMGEIEPINRCKDGIQCNETEHILNRRLEIEILDADQSN